MGTVNDVRKVLKGLGIFAGGIATGAVLRQREVNELQQQVRNLQGQLEQAQSRLNQQNDQIKMLIVKYKALKGYALGEANREKEKIHGALIYQYAYRDYVEFLLAKAQKNKLSAEEENFYSIFNRIVEGQEVGTEEIKTILAYERKTHVYEIENLIQCDFTDTFQRLRNYEA